MKILKDKSQLTLIFKYFFIDHFNYKLIYLIFYFFIAF